MNEVIIGQRSGDDDEEADHKANYREVFITVSKALL